ncbi:excinuclease ABC subunit UvrA [Methanorbis furvi]|uniref:UvrABC system protein A n=1 Tax=Methanorbis furvi TaxID=3028299 RepID=A0AAE4S9W3_9EURY|nr:UvrABC system protein A [Methanocorpusculaceae archaeon Ag1]
MKNLTIKGARQHNLQNITLELPRDKLVVVTGVSGSGKSTLAFDTIYAEGQRRYVESLSSYARQFLGIMNKPDVDSIEGLSPAISIEQKTTSKNPRSTVGTVTEIYDYLRLLYARVGVPYCPKHQVKIQSRTPEQIADAITAEFPAGSMITIFAPIIRKKKGTYEQLFRDLNADGFTRVRVDEEIFRTDDEIKLARYVMHNIDIVVDRLDPADRSRLVEAIESALKRAEDGLVYAAGAEGPDAVYSARMACPICGLSFEELQPRMFSFNSPFGACPTCNGLGIQMKFDPELIIPDKTKSIADGAVAIYRNFLDGYRVQYLDAVAKHLGFTMMTPIEELTEKQYNGLMYGTDDTLKFVMSSKNAEWSHNGQWEGLLPQTERLYRETKSEYRKEELEKFMRVLPCPECHGRRLKDHVLAVKINDKSIADVADLSIDDALVFFNTLPLTEKEEEIAKLILREINSRLSFLQQVGLGYLTLSRNAGSLSGGEAQRIRLATQIGSNLMGVLYILDEPSIGLHQRDNQKLIGTLQHLRDIGNTLIVVEHDEDTIRAADYVVDIGPGAGVHGGHVVAEGTPDQIAAAPESITGQYLSGRQVIPVPETRRPAKKFIRINGCTENNLKNIDAKIPMGTLTVVTGVSGSGKSTLIYDTLYQALMKEIYKSRVTPGSYKDLIFESEIDKVIVIDQSPIGRTPRSNPATYTKVFDDIRKLFAETKEAKLRGYDPGRFSFNLKGGRCEACSGDGVIKIEMNFLPDVYIECEECKGTRYNAETLEVKYKGKSISDVLNMSVDEALELFANVPNIRAKIETLADVGLGYIKLGQSSTTLSGGEAQRIKLTRELAKRATGKTVYLLDEPTTGLHFHDVKKLIGVLDSLVAKGNTVVVIEHNLDVIKCADYVIDLGPEGGNAGGKIIAEGTPEDVAKVKKSYTGQFLKKML